MSENDSSNNSWDQSAAGPKSMDLRMLFHIVLERVWILPVCAIIGVLIGMYQAQHAPRLYSGTATMLVEQNEQKVVKIEKVQQEDLRSLEGLHTIEQTLQSAIVLERVIKANELDRDPRFVGHISTPPPTEQLVARLKSMLNVQLRRATRLIDIKCIHTDPKIAALVPNSIVAEFTKLNLEQYSASSQGASEFLMPEAQRLRKKLEASDKALQAYREKTTSVSLEQKQEMVNQKLRELNARLTEAKSDRVRLEALNAQVNELGTNVSALMVLPLISKDPAVIAAQENIDRAQSDFSNLKLRYKAKHPKYIQAVTQLQELGLRFTNTVLNVVQAVRPAFESARAAEKALEQSVSEQEAAAIELNKQAIQYNVLVREVDSDRALYESVMNRLKEIPLAKELPSSIVRMIEPAVPPEQPFSPDKRKILMTGALVGLFLGFGLVWLFYTLDSSIKTVDQAEELLGLPVLAAVPQVQDAKQQSPLIVAEDAKSIGAEAFRSLRTSLRMLGREEDRRTLLFTSALPQEGKTFCSTNFSLCLAQQGLRTLIIDGDLRRPAVEEALLKKGEKRRGVTDYLTGQATLDEIVCETGHNNLHFIPAGTTAPNPAELLAQGHFDTLIQEALKKYDRVVVDSAPIHAVSDTLVILDKIQTVCLVVRAGKTPQKAVQRSVLLLKQAEAALGGAILNRMPTRSWGGYYSSYYDYSYKGSYSQKGVYGS